MKNHRRKKWIAVGTVGALGLGAGAAFAGPAVNNSDTPSDTVKTQTVGNSPASANTPGSVNSAASAASADSAKSAKSPATPNTPASAKSAASAASAD